MGQTLSEPITAKDTACCQDSSYRVGSSCMQGWRINMEDSHTHILSLPDDPSAAYFAVYDGHGGAKVAEHAGKHLHKHIINQPEYKEGNIPEALQKGFLEFDQAMLDDENLRNEPSGTTAVTVIIKENKLYCANVGDSRAVACIAAFPDIEERSITSDWEFLVLACDGIWDVMSNKEVITYIRENIANGLEPEEICENLMMRCLAPDCQMAGLGCDNMTVVIVAFLHGDTYEKLQEKCKREYKEEEEEEEDNIKDNDLEM